MSFFSGLEKDAETAFYFVAHLVEQYPKEAAAALRVVGSVIARVAPQVVPAVEAIVETAVAP